MTPHETLMLTGRSKWGGRRLGGGWIASYSIRDANELKGKRKETQMRLIAKAFGLSVDWVMARKWDVRKSRNLPYHPATYTLRVTTH